MVILLEASTLIFRGVEGQILQVLFDQPYATASFQIRQKTVERRIEEERVEIFVKEILRLYELAEVFAAFERPWRS